MTDIVESTPQTHATPSEGSVPRNGSAESRETVCPHVRGTVTQYCSLNFTITDDEREAIEFFADIHSDDDPPHEYAATLRKLLKRLHK